MHASTQSLRTIQARTNAKKRSKMPIAFCSPFFNGLTNLHIQNKKRSTVLGSPITIKQGRAQYLQAKNWLKQGGKGEGTKGTEARQSTLIRMKLNSIPYNASRMRSSKQKIKHRQTTTNSNAVQPLLHSCSRKSALICYLFLLRTTTTTTTTTTIFFNAASRRPPSINKEEELMIDLIDHNNTNHWSPWFLGTIVHL